MTDTYYAYCESPIGLIEIGGTTDAITSLYFVERRRHPSTPTPALGRAVQQVTAYFAGDLRTFSIPIVMEGTDFQRLVWEELRTIPFGCTATYQDIATAIGRPRAVRAVGAANGQNPISVVVPCHRVIGSDGKLVGYGGGLWRKEWLLRHEGRLLV
jgi:methylated-DNA-[protein]-cysteine S-methyltransferase